jgi:hypothetical protein
MVLNVIVNGSDQGPNIRERSSAQSFISYLPEPAFHHIQPETRRAGEVQMESRMTLQPRMDTRMLMYSVVVHDQVQIQTVRGLRIEAFEKANELLMSVSRHAVADNLAIEHTPGGEESGGAVAFVVVRLASRKAGAQRQ